MEKIIDQIRDVFVCLKKIGYGYSDMKPDNILYVCKEDCVDIVFGDIGSILEIGKPYELATFLPIMENNNGLVTTFDDKFNSFQFGIIVFYFYYYLPNNFNTQNPSLTNFYDFRYRREIFDEYLNMLNSQPTNEYYVYTLLYFNYYEKIHIING